MEKRMPLIGENFPQMEVVTTHGVMTLPDDFFKKWFILFSHPADFTPVCTTEFVAFQKRMDEFNKLDCKLIGLSVDQVFAHIKWVQWIKKKLEVQIDFPIIADNIEGVAKELGLIHPGKGTNTVRAVFIVDPKATIRAILYYPQELGRNIDEIIRMVKGLQVSDKNQVVLPANWPKNEVVGDNVIVPPARNTNKAEEMLKKNECLDWWFCYKKL